MNAVITHLIAAWIGCTVGILALALLQAGWWWRMNHQKKNWPQHRDCEHFTRTALDWGECAKGRGKVCGTEKQCVEKRYERKEGGDD